MCDITQKPRQATVTYRCSEMESSVSNRSRKVHPVRTIGLLSLLCSHPGLKHFQFESVGSIVFEDEFE